MMWIATAALIAIALAVIATLAAAAARKRGIETNARLEAKKPLTTPEQILYLRLAKALPERLN